MTPGAPRDTSKATEIPIVPPAQSSRKFGHVAVPSQVILASISGKSDHLSGCPSHRCMMVPDRLIPNVPLSNRFRFPFQLGFEPGQASFSKWTRDGSTRAPFRAFRKHECEARASTIKPRRAGAGELQSATKDDGRDAGPVRGPGRAHEAREGLEHARRGPQQATCFGRGRQRHRRASRAHGREEVQSKLCLQLGR